MGGPATPNGCFLTQVASASFAQDGGAVHWWVLIRCNPDPPPPRSRSPPSPVGGLLLLGIMFMVWYFGCTPADELHVQGDEPSVASVPANCHSPGYVAVVHRSSYLMNVMNKRNERTSKFRHCLSANSDNYVCINESEKGGKMVFLPPLYRHVLSLAHLPFQRQFQHTQNVLANTTSTAQNHTISVLWHVKAREAGWSHLQVPLAHDVANVVTLLVRIDFPPRQKKVLGSSFDRPKPEVQKLGPLLGTN